MYMTERFGAWQSGGDEQRGAVEFKLFFPDRARDASQYEATRFIDREDGAHEVPDFGDPRIESIRVAGTFQSVLGQRDWDFSVASQLARTPHEKGWLWTFRTQTELPADFYEYKYRVRFRNGEERTLSDPCSRYGGKSDQNSAFVIGGSDPTVRQLNGPRMHLRDLVVYEPRIVCEYLDERYPHPPLLPTDPVGRAQTRVALHRIEQDWYGLLPALDGAERRERERARRLLRDSVIAAEPLFRARSWFLSDQFSVLDVAVAPMLWRLARWEIQLNDAAPALLRYAQRIFARPAFRACLSDAEREMQA